MTAMMAAGADGCRAGWICVMRELGHGRVRSGSFATAAALFAQDPRPEMLGIDIPIGLTDKGARDCDKEGRRVLGRPRASSVFPAPIRPVLAAGSWEEACAIRERVDGKRMSKQAWAIVGKIRDVDREMIRCSTLQGRIREVHPEVSFWGWAGRAMRHRKTSRAGRQERLTVVESHFGSGAFGAVRELYPVSRVGHDDILDAFAALWSAERILQGDAQTLPRHPRVDRRGLRMEIVY
jgi:predicted RNase H-like nuclease